MYAIHFRKDFNTPNNFTIIADNLSLPEAKRLRVVSGDLVVNQKTKKVVQSDYWLWDWEKKDPSCYARKAMAADTAT